MTLTKQSAPAVQADIRRFEASDGYRFHYRHWPAAGGSLRGYVVAVHGIQSHSGWYEYSSRRLAEAGYEVSFLDRRGSGLNELNRGDAPHEDRLINDVVQFLASVQYHRNREARSAPVVLLGVSWGGKLAAVTCAKRPELVDGLALLYPGLIARVRPRWYQRIQLEAARLLGIRNRLVPIPLDDPRQFTGQPTWQQFIRDDPLALHEVTVRFLLANQNLDRLAAESPQQVRCPLLMMLSGKDRIIDNPRTRLLFERFAAANRKLIEYPEAAHTLEFEPNRERWISDLINWLATLNAGRGGRL